MLTVFIVCVWGDRDYYHTVTVCRGTSPPFLFIKNRLGLVVNDEREGKRGESNDGQRTGEKGGKTRFRYLSIVPKKYVMYLG